MEQQGQNPDPRLRNLNFPSGQPQTLTDEALQFGFELMVEQGFKGTALDLEKLLREDEEALEFTYGLFVDNNFQGDLDDFKGLLGMEKKPMPKEDPPPSEQQALLDLLNSPTQNISTPAVAVSDTVDSILEPLEEDKPPTEEEAKAREERDQEDIQQALKFARESEDQSIGKSFGNSLSNFLINLEGTDGRAKMFLDIAFQDDEDIMESARIVRENRAKHKPVFQPMDVYDEGLTLEGLEAFGGALFDAITGIGTSLVQGAQGAVVGGALGLAGGALTGGPIGALGGLATGTTLGFTAGFTSDMIANAVIDNNIEKAKRLGITVEDLVKRGDADIFPGMTIGMIQGQLERVGLNKLFKGFANGLKNKYAKSFVDLFGVGATNALQEVGQGYGDILNREFGREKNRLGNIIDPNTNDEFLERISLLRGENYKALINQGVAGLLGGIGTRGPALAINSTATARKAKEALRKKYTKSEIARLVSSVQTRPEFKRIENILGRLSDNKKNTAKVETQADVDAIVKDNAGLHSELNEIQDRAVVRAAKLSDEEIANDIYPLYDKINDITLTIDAIENASFLSEDQKQEQISQYNKQLEVLYRKQELIIEALNQKPNDIIEENFFIDGERVTKQQFDEYTLSQKGILQEVINDKGQPERTYEKVTGSESNLKTTFYKTIGERGKKQYPVKPPLEVALRGFEVDEQNVEEGFTITGIESINEVGDNITAFAETKNEDTNETSGAVLLLSRREGARLTQEQKEINEAAKILDGKNSEPLFKVEDSPEMIPDEQEIQTMTDQLNSLDSDVINLDLPTDLTTTNSIDIEGIQNRFGNLPVLDVNGLKQFQNLRVLFGMSDPLFTGAKTNPQTGNDIEYDGGLLFNLKYKNLAWASSKRNLEANDLARAKAIYERDPVPYDILWEKRPDLYGHVVKAIVKMEDESIASNEAFFRVAIDNLSTLPKRNLRRAKNTLINEIQNLRVKNVDGVGKKQINESNKKRILDFLKSKEDLIDVFQNIKDLTTISDRVNITKRVFSGDVMIEVDKVSEPQKAVPQELLRGQKPEKANLLHQRRIFEALNEDAMSEIPSNHIISLVGVDIFTGETREISHPNYGFGNKGKLIGILKNPIHAADMFPEIRSKIPAMLKPDVKGKMPSLKTAITQAVDPRTAPTRIELQDAKITSKMDNMKELMGVLKLSFPDVSVFDTQYEFEKGLLENNVRMYNKGGKDIYGFTTGNKIFLNPKHINEGVLLHEYGHVWQDFLRKNNMDLLNVGYDLIQKDKGFEEYKIIYGEKNADGTDNFDVARDEYMADLISTRGQALLEAANRSRFVNFLNAVFTYIKRFFRKFTNMSPEQVQGMTMGEFIDGSISSILSARMNTEQETKKIKNIRFNKRSPADDIRTLLDKKGIAESTIIRTIVARHKLSAEKVNELFKVISKEYQEQQLKLDGLNLGFRLRGKEINLNRNKIIDGFKELFSSRYRNPLSVQQLQDKKHGRLNRRLQDTIILLEKLQSQLKKEKDGISDVRKIIDGTLLAFIPDPKTQKLKLNPELTISEELAQLAAEGRMRVDELTRLLIKSGAISNKEAINNVESNIGQYLNRTFAVFDDPKYQENKNKLETDEGVAGEEYRKLKAEVKKELEGYDVIIEEAGRIKDKYPGRNFKDIKDQLVEQKYQELLSLGSRSYPFNATRGDKKVINILKQRKEIPPAIRKLMGEEKDPIINLGNTLSKMTFLHEQQRYLNDLRKAGMGVYFFNKNDINAKRLETITGQKLVPIVDQKSSGLLNPLNGLYTYQYLAETIKGINQGGTLINLFRGLETAVGSSSRTLGKAAKIYRQIVGYTKIAKTILSPATHGVNVTGNLLFMAVNGYTDPRAFLTAMNDVRKGYKSLSKQGKQDLYRTLLDNNVIDQSVVANEIESLFETRRDLNSSHDYIQKRRELLEKNFKGNSPLRKIYKYAERAYRKEDDFFKIVAFQIERDRQAKMDYNGANFKQLSDEQKSKINTKAANIVKDILPNYSRIGAINNFYKGLPLFATFVSFTIESIRTAGNTVRLAFDEAKKGNPKRLISIIASQFAYKGIQSLVGLDLDDDEEEENRALLPYWAVNHEIKVLPQKERGVMRYIDFTQSDPHAYFKEIIMAYMQGKSTKDSMKESILQAIQPFISVDIVRESITKTIDALNIEDDSTTDIVAKIINAIGVLEPGAFRQGKQLYDAHLKDVLGQTVAGMLTGYKVREVNASQTVFFEAKKLRNQITSLREGREQVQKFRGNLPPTKILGYEVGPPTEEQVDESIETTQRYRQKHYQELFMLYKGALNAGLTHDEVADEIEKAGFSKTLTKNLRSALGYKEFPNVPYKPY